MKSNSKVTISEKQRAWLLGQARKEGVKITSSFGDIIYLDGCHYQIKNCRRLASGGSYVGTAVVPGKYNIEKLFYVEFTDTGNKMIAGVYDLERYKNEGHKFQVISLKNYV